MNPTILLNLDGVLIRIPPWRMSERFTGRILAFGIEVAALSLINDSPTMACMPRRVAKVQKWIAVRGRDRHFLIIDDDGSLHDLPYLDRNRWVKTSPLVELTDEGGDQDNWDFGDAICC